MNDVTENLNWVARSLEGIFGTSRASRAFTLILIIMFILFMFWIYDAYTGTFRLKSTEQRIEMLKTLHELKKDGVDNDPELEPVYLELVQEVDDYDPKVTNTIANLSNASFQVNTKANTIQIIAGSLLWTAIAMAVVINPKQKEKLNSFVGIIILGIIWAFIVSLPIPNLSGNLGNIIISIFVHIVIIFGLAWVFGTPSKKPSQQETNEPH